MTKDLSDKDKEIWDHVARSVKPLPTRKKPAAPTRKASARTEKPVAKISAAKTPPTIATKPAASKISVQPSAKTPVFNTGFDSATETKLKKGKLEIEGRIDLHGMTQDEAFRVLQRFIQSSIRQEKRNLLVITGKGKLSTGGVLRRNLPLWLEGNPHILALTPAAPKDGGGGAFYIRLRKKK